MTIRTTHVGSLPRTPELLKANAAHREGSLSDADFTSVLQAEVDGVVKRQAEIGLDTRQRWRVRPRDARHG